MELQSQGRDTFTFEELHSRFDLSEKTLLQGLYRKIGLNRTTTVLQELAQSMRVSTLLRTTKRYPSTAIIERFGYILDIVLGEERFAGELQKVLSNRKIGPVLLSIQKDRRGDMAENRDQ